MSRYLILPRYLAFLCRHFSGLRKRVSRRYVTSDTIGCEFQKIRFPFDRKVMDGKRLIAIACGAIEAEEIAMAKRCLNADDRLVEFGMGLGIAAAMAHHACRPQLHHCFEANPAVIGYARKLFALNGFEIEIHNKALGDGRSMPFFAVDDYMRSAFDRPTGRQDFREISVPTERIEDILARLRPTALFCDIEGAELTFLDPAQLGTVQKVVIELHPGIYGTARMNEYVSAFRDNGFAVAGKAGTSYLFIRKA